MKRIRNVMIVELLQAEFEALKTKFNNTFYWCTDTDKLYKGANAVGGGDTPGPGPEPGNNDFVVTYVDNDDTLTADKTFAEILSAINAGKNIKAIYTNAERDWFYHFTTYETDMDYVMFSYLSCDFAGGSKPVNAMFIVHEEDRIQMINKDVTTT